MDDFGVLTQSMGIKPQGKAAPMAALKQSSRPASHQPHSKIPSFSNSDDVFGPTGFGKSSNRSVANSSSGSFYDADDVFGEMPGFRSSGSPDSDDVFGSFGVNQTAPVGDLFGGSGAMTVKGSASPAGFDNLIPGFGGSTVKSNGYA